jgi:hypothetical protein
MISGREALEQGFCFRWRFLELWPCRRIARGSKGWHGEALAAKALGRKPRGQLTVKIFAEQKRLDAVSRAGKLKKRPSVSKAFFAEWWPM